MTFPFVLCISDSYFFPIEVMPKRPMYELSTYYLGIGYRLSGFSFAIRDPSRHRTILKEKDVPEDVMKAVKEYMSEPFFEIDYLKYKSSKLS